MQIIGLHAGSRPCADRWATRDLAGEPSIGGSAIGAFLCLTRVVTGPIMLAGQRCTSASATASSTQASPFCPAYAGPAISRRPAARCISRIRPSSAGSGRRRSGSRPIPSSTPALAATIRGGRPSGRSVARWAACASAGCRGIRSRRDGTNACRLTPAIAGRAATRFVSLRFGQPGYCLLSGDTPLAIWKGADNGSQIGVFLPIQETEAATNVAIRSEEYLPANLERGVFLIHPDPSTKPSPVWILTVCTEGRHAVPETASPSKNTRRHRYRIDLDATGNCDSPKRSWL